ncbi:hypothetical protein [Mesorhizobium muleiense]|uniref:TrbM protein n=1 Tax=Mesorhizobium muleiense TaxID=1004279 RepID=A0A1G9BW05_9HYPH|nr:hypothetical protein [Mesorhizobium muleiense]MCF6103852.1 hypothetical protein [Mesorhizobium muleiense]SDK43619.1 hypothetical protein SAMN05428953_11585 [Mesorhizobium muleiense]
MKTIKHIRTASISIAALALAVTSLGSTNAQAGSEAFDTGYQMAAFLLCPSVYKYSDMKNFNKYDKTSEYKRGFAALRAALKGPRPSKVCFDAARASGWFNAR